MPKDVVNVAGRTKPMFEHWIRGASLMPQCNVAFPPLHSNEVGRHGSSENLKFRVRRRDKISDYTRCNRMSVDPLCVDNFQPRKQLLEGVCRYQFQINGGQRAFRPQKYVNPDATVLGGLVDPSTSLIAINFSWHGDRRRLRIRTLLDPMISSAGRWPRISIITSSGNNEKSRGIWCNFDSGLGVKSERERLRCGSDDAEMQQAREMPTTRGPKRFLVD